MDLSARLWLDGVLGNSLIGERLEIRSPLAGCGGPAPRKLGIGLWLRVLEYTRIGDVRAQVAYFPGFRAPNVWGSGRERLPSAH